MNSFSGEPLDSQIDWICETCWSYHYLSLVGCVIWLKVWVRQTLEITWCERPHLLNVTIKLLLKELENATLHVWMIMRVLSKYREPPLLHIEQSFSNMAILKWALAFGAIYKGGWLEALFHRGDSNQCWEKKSEITPAIAPVLRFLSYFAIDLHKTGREVWVAYLQ